jgi:hypothetical protein
MSFFLLPSLSFNENIDKLMNVVTEEKATPFINKTLCGYLNKIKDLISSRQVLWDQYKKFANPYEYIHSYVPNTSHSVCKLAPLSRAFFKLIELVNMLNLFEFISPIQIFLGKPIEFR